MHTIQQTSKQDITLLELFIIVFIVAVLAAFTVPNMLEAIRQNSTAQEEKTDINILVNVVHEFSMNSTSNRS